MEWVRLGGLAFLAGMAVQFLMGRAINRWRRRRSATGGLIQQLTRSLVQIRHLSARISAAAREYIARLDGIETRLASLPEQADNATVYAAAVSGELREINAEVEARICPLFDGLQQHTHAIEQQLMKFASRLRGGQLEALGSGSDGSNGLPELRVATLDLMQPGMSTLGRMRKAETPELRSNHPAESCNARGGSRKCAASIQYLATYRQGDLLAPGNFRAVGCNDFSLDGFSFWAATAPEDKYLAVRTATGRQLNYSIAEIVSATDDDSPHGKRCLVECRFVEEALV